MPTREASLVLVLVLALAACTGAAAPPQPPTATPRATPAPSPTPRPSVPPKPTGVTFDESEACLLGEDPDTGTCRYPDEADDPNGTVPYLEVTRTVTWSAPRTAGVEIRVYGVTGCVSMPANPKPGTSGPCLVEHTALPSSILVPLATAPAAAGKASWSWRGTEPGCDIWYPVGWIDEGFEKSYEAVVVGAYSASGHSIMAIATAGEWSEPSWEPDDLPC